MKGKVKCTCGWSWNKSDSSKKDMYICHECGRDNSNNMKNGGWLDKAQGGENLIKDERSQAFTPSVSTRVKMPNAFKIDKSIQEREKESKKEREDEQEFRSTGFVKYPRSIKFQKQEKELEKKKTYLTKTKYKTEAAKEYDQKKAQAIEDKKQFKKNILAPLDVTTDIMQLGNFVPHPIGQTIGKIGNVAGSALDAYQAVDDFSEGNYTDAAINAGSVFLPMALGSQTFRRNSKYLQPGQPLYPFSPQARNNFIDRAHYIEPFNKVKGMTDTSLLANRALLGTLGAETIYDASSMFSDPEITPTIDTYKTIQYYNTDPKRGEVEKPGESSNVQYVPVSNSAELKKWKKQKLTPIDSLEPEDLVRFPEQLPKADIPIIKQKNGGWLDSYDVPQAQNGIEGTMAGLTDKGFNYNGAWGGQFKDGGFIPIAQDGRATRADSLAVFNNAVALNKHYDNLRKKGFYETPEKRDLSYLKNPYHDSLEKNLELEKLKKETLKYYRDAFKEDPTTRGDWDDFKRTYPNKTKEDYKKGLAKSLKETKSGNKNKYYYKDIYPSQIDVLAPSTLIDTRIVPQYILDYNAKNKDKSPAGGSVTGMYGYDPLAVKPFNMLTDAEKKLRIEKYGTDGIPKSYLNKSKTTTTKETTKPKPDKPEFDKKRDKLTPIQNNIQPAGLAQSSMELNSDVSGLRPQARIPKYYDVEDIVNNGKSQTNYQWYPGNNEALRQLSEESGDKRTMVPRYQDGGKTFLQPTSDKLPEGYRIPFSDPSSELAMSIGGEGGEPAYLIPSFKYGRPLADPMLEFRNTGEHLGGPFKTYQEADEWERTVRHPAVEKRENIMFPIQEFQTGGSLPGSVGFTYARTKGIPSEGPYAKKTLPSAQNGQEMKFYQEGLDWKPKGMRDGGWLDGYEKAQDGYTTGDKVEYGTPEYTEAYNRGEVITDKGVRSPIALDEVVIQNNYKRPRGVWEQYADKIAEENKDAGLLGAIIGTPISAITSLPQLMGMKALTGEMQRPSEAMDIENPYGAFAVDAVADPANLIGANVLTKGKAFSKLGKISTSIAPELRQGLQTNGISFVNNPKRGENAFKLINDDNKEWIGDLDLTKNYWDDSAKGQWTIDNVAIEKPYRGKGFGKESYIKANDLLESTNRGSLHSSGNFEGPDAKHLWRSLVNSGHAEEIGKNAWKFKSKLEEGGIIKDDRGQWDHPGEITEINSPYITMQGVPYPVLGVSDTGDTQMMYPEEDYEFDGEKVTEYPMAQTGFKLDLNKGPAGNMKQSLITAINKDKKQTPDIKERKTTVVDNTSVKQNKQKKIVDIPLTEKEILKNSINSQSRFMKDWMNSPMYDEMVDNSTTGYFDKKYLNSGRNFNFDGIKIKTYDQQPENMPDTGASSNSQTGLIKLYPEGYQSNAVQGMLAHEISHSSDKPAYWEDDWFQQHGIKPVNKYNNEHRKKEVRLIPEKDINLMKSFYSDNKVYKNLFNKSALKNKDLNEQREWFNYVSEPTETRARLNDIRYNAKTHGIYDPFTQKVTPEILNEIKELTKKAGGFDPFNQLQGVYSDEEILKLLNTVSQNEQSNEDPNVAIARNGLRQEQKGLVNLDNLLNFTNYNESESDGWLDKYQDGGPIPGTSIKPLELKKELPFEKIPTTDNKKIVIDNFSPDYDYIVEGDNTYYKVKGGNSWADISNNTKARKNLLEFLDKNNYWAGYGSGEKAKFDKIKNQPVIVPGGKVPKTTPTIIRNAETGNKPTIVKRPIQKVIKEEPGFFDDVSDFVSSGIDSLEKKWGDVKKETKVIAKSVEDAVASGLDKAINTTEDVYHTVINGIQRKYKTYTGDDDDVEVKTSANQNPKTVKEWYGDKSGAEITQVLDAPNVPGRTYKQQVLPTSNIKFGIRNRGEYKDIKTDGLEVTTFQPFTKNALPDETSVLAIDANGNLHTGQYKDFKGKKDYMFSKTFRNKIIDFSEVNGKGEYVSGEKSGNPKYQQPKIKVLDDNGKVVNGSLNILVKDDSKKDYYGQVQGGRILFVNPTTKEQYLVSGSISHIKEKFKELKGNNKYLEAYTLDNGTYSRGLSYKDKKLTKDRLKSYDLENTSGGNGLYIIDYKQPVSKYKEEYINNMPNVRTKNDESYKKGHPLKNEVKNIVLHHTAYEGPNAEKDLNKQYMTPGKSSSHIVIQENGKRSIYASPEQVTFHAGDSEWNKRKDVNDFSIGVEFQGDTNKKPLTQAQIESFVEYYAPLAKKYNLSLKDIITHEMIAPGRKPDITKKEYSRILNYMKSKNFK